MILPAFWKVARRGEMSVLLLAALLVFLAAPGQAAALPPGSCEAVLVWLQAETQAAVPARLQGAKLLALSAPQASESEKIAATATLESVASAHFAPPLSEPQTPQTTKPAPRLLEWHEAAARAGVRTNSNLE